MYVYVPFVITTTAPPLIVRLTKPFQPMSFSVAFTDQSVFGPVTLMLSVPPTEYPSSTPPPEVTRFVP